MGTSHSRKNYLQVAIFWGGAELGTYSRLFHRAHGVVAGNSFFADIKSKIWPRWDSLEIISKTKHGLVLNPNIPWDGVIQSNGTVHILRSLRSARRIFEIKDGTTASLRLDDMTISIKVGPKPLGEKSRIQPARGYGASPLQFLADKPSEWISLATATLAAGVISVSAYSTLKSRDNDHFNGIAELPSLNLFPFIAQKHLAEAPNVIQFTLDRFNYVHSVWNFYSELSDVIGFGKTIAGEPLIFQSTVDAYRSLATAQSQAVSEAEAQQKLEAKRRRPDQGIISIPVVRGENIDSKILRVLDKIAVYSEAAKELAAKRVVVADSFEKDIGLSKDAKAEAPKNEAFEKIAQGYLGIESDDKMQENQAKNASARAALVQIDLFGEDRLRFGAIDCCAPLAGAPMSQAGFSWLSPDAVSAEDFVSLAALKGSTWGEPIKDEPKIIEPVRGQIDPTLVEKTVSAGRYQLRLCYELALRRNQTTKGSMEWKWQINSQGKISNINLLSTSIKDEELVRCIHDKIATWKFTKPKGGSVEIRYPFEFSRDKG